VGSAKARLRTRNIMKVKASLAIEGYDEESFWGFRFGIN